jgi:hypothetical protein
MRQSNTNAELEALDQAFYLDRETRGPRCKKYAIVHALYKDG